MYCSHDVHAKFYVFGYDASMSQSIAPTSIHVFLCQNAIFAPLVPMHLGVTGHETADAVFRVQLCVTALHVYTKTYTNSTLVQSFLHHWYCVHVKCTTL